VAACSGDDAPTPPATEGPAALRAAALQAGLAPMPHEPVRPVENPYLADKVELGHLLFFDPILSGPLDLACSTCHLPRLGFADGRPFPSGAGGVDLGPDRTEPPPPMRPMERNSPTVLNTGLFGRMSPVPTVNGTIFWSGSAFGIEDQALNPIAAEKELRGLAYSKVHATDSVLRRLRSLPAYVDLFADGFPLIESAHGRDPDRLITASTLRLALAAYMRELITPDAPLDRFLAGDDRALTEQEQQGLELFIDKAGCVACHTGPLLSDFSMHVIGARQAGIGRDSTPGDDFGWGEHGGELYAFRTAPLRQVEHTAPYLHAGTAETLADVIRFKNLGRSEHPEVADAALDPRVAPLGLSESEIQALVAFLRALTDETTTLGALFQAPEQVPSGLTVPR
jgi:cytochrome c peroxidase